MLMRFKEAPDPPPADTVPAEWGDKVMHASLKIGELRLMLSDGCAGDGSTPAGYALSLSVADAGTVDRTIAALAEGGEITMPADATFWSPRFGMLRDRFGVQWMVGIDG
jgi:PhnB protein